MRRRVATCVAVAALLAAGMSPRAGAAQDARVLPPDAAALTSALAKAGVRETPLSSCRGEIRAGHPDEWVIATGTATGGRYLLVQDDGRTLQVETYEGAPELRCLGIRQADALTAEIARSTTMNGRITAEWDGLVVCGAITPVITACWQHAVERKGFASVGGWMRAQPDETTRP